MTTKSNQRKSKERRKDAKLVIIILILTITYVSSLSSLYTRYEMERQESKHAEEIHDWEDELAEIQRQHTIEIASIRSYYDHKYAEYVLTIAQNDEYISTLENTIDILNFEYSVEAERELSLYHKYWYVIKDASPDTGITMDLIAYADAVCREGNINPHLVWAIIKLESHYNIDIFNTSSDAGGLGQFMEGTGRYVYEVMLGHGQGSYTHHITAADPYANIAMMVAYLNYLLNNHNGDLSSSLFQYSGGSGTYYNTVAANMSSVGYDIRTTSYI